MQKNKLIKPILFLGLFVSMIFLNSCIGMIGMCGESCGMGGHSGHSMNSDHDMQNSGGGDTSVIRTGIIDINAIDIDKDGNVFQDPMHWNVISDKAGTCPLCGMELNKVKIKEAIKNLKENDFNVK